MDGVSVVRTDGTLWAGPIGYGVGERGAESLEARVEWRVGGE